MENKGPKWYFQTWSLIVSFLVIGPLMLPLVWANPRFSRKNKIIISILAVLFTILLSLVLVKTLKLLNDYYNQMLATQY